MFSQFVFVLKIKIKQAFPLLVHMRFLFSKADGHGFFANGHGSFANGHVPH